MGEEEDLIMLIDLGVRQRRTENPLRERLLVRNFLQQIENYYHQQQLSIICPDQMEVDEGKTSRMRKQNHSLVYFS